MTELELKDWVENRVDMVKPQISRSSKNSKGIPFITFTSGGIKPQGEATAKFPSLEKAIEYFQLSFEKYLISHPEGLKILEWRMLPTIMSNQEYEILTQQPSYISYYIACRFTISGY